MSLEELYAVSSRFQLHKAGLCDTEQVTLGRSAGELSLKQTRIDYLKLRFEHRIARLTGIDLPFTQFKQFILFNFFEFADELMWGQHLHGVEQVDKFFIFLSGEIIPKEIVELPQDGNTHKKYFPHCLSELLYIIYMKRKQNKTLKKVVSSQETISIIEQELKELKQKVKATAKIKGQERRNAVIKIEKVEIRNLSNLIMILENSIYTHEQDEDYQTAEILTKRHDQFNNSFQKLKKELEFIRNEGRKEEDIYQGRRGNEPNTKEQYAERIEKAQVQSEMAVKNMLRMLHQTKEIGNSVNVQLQRQIEALDNVNQNLQQTESTMNRALRHINYFARSVYTDKLLMVLLILVVLAVVAIIILSALGKVSGPTTDVLS